MQSGCISPGMIEASVYQLPQSYDNFSNNNISSYCVIVRVRVVLKRTVVGDRRFDNLSESHLQSQVKEKYLSVDDVIKLVR